MLDLGKSITEMEGLTVFDYADLFKLFLRSLPDPLVPENLTALYISSALVKHFFILDFIVLYCTLFYLFISNNTNIFFFFFFLKSVTR